MELQPKLIVPGLARFVRQTRYFEEPEVPEKAERIEKLKCVLDVNIPVCVIDVSCIYDKFGFDEEFELLLETPLWFYDQFGYINVMAVLILNFELFVAENLRSLLNEHFRDVFTQIRRDNAVVSDRWNEFFCVAQFFTVYVNSPLMKRTVPTLLELSRDQTRAAIALKYPKRTTRFYHSYVKQLPIPQRLVDIVRLKAPVNDKLNPSFGDYYVQNPSQLCSRLRRLGVDFENILKNTNLCCPLNNQ